jgi:predicted secreted hydrolase
MTQDRRRRSSRLGARAGLVVALAIVLAACSSGGGPILARPVAARPTIAPPTAAPSAAHDPVPVVLPRDDGPHDRLTEWWYYTGHLRAAGGARYGFEFVIFRAERGRFPTSWVSHLAITDETGDRFLYSQRLEVGAQADRSPLGPDGAPTGFDLALGPGGFAGTPVGSATPDGSPPLDAPWAMAGSDGHDHLQARMTSAEAALAGAPAGVGLDLDLTATKAPALHGDDGLIDFGPAGGSYYYSRTAMDATGSLTVDGRTLAVEGSAWFDHQWGDFISVGGGGWDWFAVNLDDGTDLTLSLVREADGTYPLIYGTVVAPDGTVRHLERDAFSVAVTDRWTSPATGAIYPAGWTVRIPGDDLTITLRPTVAAQELDTRATTGVVYWEGSQDVQATRGQVSLGGEGYVELTGYAASIGGS